MENGPIAGIQIAKSAHSGGGTPEYEIKVLREQTSLMERKINELVMHVNELTAAVEALEKK